MVNSIGTSSSSALPATPAAVSARSKTAAGQKLDAALDSLKAGNGVAATNQAKRQMDQARVKLAGLMLAAGSAAAMGNGRMARNVADDCAALPIRAAWRRACRAGSRYQVRRQEVNGTGTRI